ncbi:MAG: hypothetical protein RLY14_456 [Planctomycetota bacterium]
MSRNPSLGIEKASADCTQASSLQPDQVEARHEKPTSRKKLTGVDTFFAWLVQLGATGWDTTCNQFENKHQARKDSFPRFLFWAVHRLYSARSSAFRLVESIRSRLAKYLNQMFHRPTGECLSTRPDPGVSLLLGRAVSQSGSKSRRVTRAKDRSELPEHLVTGSQGEQLVLDYLLQKGWRLIDRNVRALGGEIDLVMLDQDTVVFVEVKTWGSKTDEDPAEAVDLYKQRTLTRAGLAFLRKKRWLERPARFDVVSVRISERGSVASGEERGPTLRHFRSAFESQGDSFFG